MNNIKSQKLHTERPQQTPSHCDSNDSTIYSYKMQKFIKSFEKCFLQEELEKKIRK